MQNSRAETRLFRADTLMSEQLVRIEQAGEEHLRERWKDMFGKEAPATMDSGMIARAIAYRLQAQVYGDVRLGQALVRQGQSEAEAEADARAYASVKLIRSWGGELHEVEAAGDRFLYRGESWRSLSAIAHHITGTKYNGLTFFGVSDRAHLSRAVRRG